MSYPHSYDEKEILSQVATGDELAFSALLKKYHQLLGTYVLRFTRSRELTEEIVQDVFMKIWVNKEMLTTVADFRAYLFVLTKNHVLNCLKKQARERLLTTSLDALPVIPDVRDPLTTNTHYELIDEAIDQLPPQQQKVYLMSRHERLKYAEIALRLNISRETVKKYLQISSDSIAAYIRNKLVNKTLFILFYFFH